MSKIYKEMPKNPINKWSKDLNRHFSREDIEMGYRHMKKCSMSLFIREMQIKTTHLLEQLSSINNKQQVLARMWRKGNLLHCWWECRLVQPLWGAAWRYLRKLKMDLPFGPAIPLLGIYPMEHKTLI